MPELHSTPPTKPAKPYPNFPLTPHPTGRWCKKIRGKLHYFGPIDNPQAALDNYNAKKDDLHAGRTPRPDHDTLTVEALAVAFLTQKEALVDAGELSPRTMGDYKAAVALLGTGFGRKRLLADLRPDDFAALRNKLAKRWGPHLLGKTIQEIRSVFKFGFESGMMNTPMQFGPGFARPSKKTFRLNRAKQGTKLFTAEELRRMLGYPPWRPAAGGQLAAMILLGINCGFGNSDCATLPLSALDLDGGWINYPRPKTGIPRRCPLWPETVAALRAVLAERKEPKDQADADLVFVTRFGQGWGKDIADSPITKETRKLLDQLAINGHRNFYTIRHTFRTVADEVKDQPAADFIMGHEVPHMSSVYRETISDQRLQAVVDYVRGWLLPAAGCAHC